MSMSVGIRAWSKEIPQYINDLYKQSGDYTYIQDLNIIQNGFQNGFDDDGLNLLRKYVTKMYKDELHYINRKINIKK